MYRKSLTFTENVCLLRWKIRWTGCSVKLVWVSSRNQVRRRLARVSLVYLVFASISDYIFLLSMFIWLFFVRLSISACMSRFGVWLLGSGLLHCTLPEGEKESDQCRMLWSGSVQQVCALQRINTKGCLLSAITSTMTISCSLCPAVSTVATGSSEGEWSLIEKSRRRHSLVLLWAPSTIATRTMSSNSVTTAG